MTVEEAIFKCKYEVDFDCGTDNTEDLESIVINALGKQIPKKPIKRNPIIYRITKDGQKTYAYQHFCPLCDTKLKFTDHHCPCGQAIDWSDAE